MQNQVKLLTNECRAFSLSDHSWTIFWDKCTNLSRSISPQGDGISDEVVNVAITQVDAIINENENSCNTFKLAMLLMRANLESMLITNNHEDESTEIYFTKINEFLEKPQDTDTYGIKASENKETIGYFVSLVKQIRPFLLKRAEEAATLLNKAISWMQTEETQLTPLHAHLCILALQKPLSRSKMSFLSCDFSCVHPCLTEAKHFLLFFYYGAILFGTQQDWESMQFYLEQAISLPATGHVSQITIDAYKKFLLVSLIRGQEPLLPKYAVSSRSQQELFITTRSLNQQATQAHTNRQSASGLGHVTRYRSFVNNCKAGKEAEELSTLQPLLEADGNWSLARCAIQHLIERRILELKAIFVTIPLSEVARRVGLEDESEAANYISSMIEREKIKGKIEEWNQERLLVFEEKYLIEEEKIRKEFEDKKSLSMNLLSKIKELDRDIQRHPNYVKKTSTEEESKSENRASYLSSKVSVS